MSRPSSPAGGHRHGYTTALLCERLGSAYVTSIDVDPGLTAAARHRLRRCGYTPTVIIGDGAQGHLGQAPYDRIIVGFAVTGIPAAWTNQTRAGGIILAPVLSGLVKLTVTGQGTAQGPFRFFLELTIPGLAHGCRDADPHNLLISPPDGSHAHVTSEGDLTQSGPRKLWDDIETIHQTWKSLGAPPRECFGLTVTPDHQTIWLDTPGSNRQWSVG